MNKMTSGIWSGLLATGPMTLGLFEIQNRMPKDERSPLPPATLTNQITGVSNPNVTMLAHFSYGAVAGILYSMFTSQKTKSPLRRGLFYGLSVWTVSYLGWIPFFGFRARASNLTASRNFMMVLCHIIWGASLGWADKHLQQSGELMLRGNRKATNAE